LRTKSKLQLELKLFGSYHNLKGKIVFGFIKTSSVTKLSKWRKNINSYRKTNRKLILL